MLAELDAFKRICTLMAAHGKVVTVSLKTHFSNISDQQGQYLCDKDMSDDNTTSCIPYGEEKVCQCYHLETMQRRDFCLYHCTTCACSGILSSRTYANCEILPCVCLVFALTTKVFEVLGPTGAFIPHRQYNIPSRDYGDAAHGGR